MEFVGAATPMAEEEFDRAARVIGCDVAAIKAVADVESRGNPFLPDQRPTILYERHIFSRRTQRRFDEEDSNISSRKPGDYGASGAHQYDRLAKAIERDRDAALESASWGRFQIMGFNHRVVGFDDVESFVAAMCEGEANHLSAFVEFVRGNRLDDELRNHDWAGFARGYNGPNFAINKYDEKMEVAYRRLAGGIARGGGFRVRTTSDLQAALNFLGAKAGTVDGQMGPKTRGAITRFQRLVRMPETGIDNAALKQAVQAVYFALGGKE